MGRLSPWQAVRRRIALWGGSYTHPDGYIELDIDEKAGVTRADSQDEAASKIDAYNERQARRDRRSAAGSGAILLGIVTWAFAQKIGFAPWLDVGLGVAVAGAVWQIASACVRH